MFSDHRHINKLLIQILYWEFKNEQNMQNGLSCAAHTTAVSQRTDAYHVCFKDAFALQRTEGKLLSPCWDKPLWISKSTSEVYIFMQGLIATLLWPVFLNEKKGLQRVTDHLHIGLGNRGIFLSVCFSFLSLFYWQACKMSSCSVGETGFVLSWEAQWLEDKCTHAIDSECFPGSSFWGHGWMEHRGSWWSH